MAIISQSANLSKRYTNHKIKGATATAMKKAGHTLEEIAFMTKHKNLESLKLYLAKLTMEEKENFSKLLCNYSKTAGERTKSKKSLKEISNKYYFSTTKIAKITKNTKAITSTTNDNTNSSFITGYNHLHTT